MTSLDLDKRKVFSILERKARGIENSENKNLTEIKLSLIHDLYRKNEPVSKEMNDEVEIDPYFGRVPLIQNEEALDDILLTIEERSHRRFTYKVGHERKLVYVGEENQVDSKGKIINVSTIEKFDLIYTVIFNPKIPAIDPKEFLDRSEYLYITKDGPDYYFENQLLKLGKGSNYYLVFNCLYALASEGGFVLYENLLDQLKSKGTPKSNLTQKFISDNLTSNQNGFIKKANIPPTLPNGKKLLIVERNVGVHFNNKK